MNTIKFREPNLIVALLGAASVLTLYYVYFNVQFTGLNSDHAIHILMTKEPYLPYGLYYWGQNRLGSIIPMVGHLFYSIGFTALLATAISQTLLLLLAAYFFARFFSAPILKLAVLTVLILPIYPFFTQVEIGHPVIGQFFFTGLTLYLYFFKFSKNKLYQFLFGLCAALSLWASELSVAVLLSLAIVENIRLFKKLKLSPLFAPLGFALGVVFILFAKNNVAKVQGYHKLFASVSSALSSIGNHLTELFKMMVFDTNKPFNTILIYSILAVLFLLIAIGVKNKVKPSRPTLLFFLSSLFTLLAVHFSNWNAMMERPLHHFTPAYFFFFLSVLSYAQQVAQKKPYLKYAILFPVIAQAYASITFVTIFNLDVPERINRNDAVELANVVENSYGFTQFTVIGNYWNTYIVDALNENVIAVPYQGGHLRSDRYLDEAMANDDFILIKNGWLEEFPDTTYQWDKTLIRVSEPDTLNKTVYTLYKKHVPD